MLLSNTKIHRINETKDKGYTPEELDPKTDPIAAKILEALTKVDVIKVKSKPSELRAMAEANRQLKTDGGGTLERPTE